MKINIAKSAGFCFGVKRAQSIALDASKNRKNVYMLGDIVHNEDVVKMIKAAGIKKSNRIITGKSRTILIRAHGAPRKIYTNAKRAGNNIVDATCPMVKEIHRIAKHAEETGFKVIVIGDPNHDEVKGIVGQLKTKAIVVDPSKKILAYLIKNIKKAAVVAQSTQKLDKVLAVIDNLKVFIPELKFHNTICNPTRIKQKEMHSMPLENNVMIIIGSKASANTKRLYEISKSLNPHSYWIQSKDQIKKSWFKGTKTVGITSGASTPDGTTKDVTERIKILTS